MEACYGGADVMERPCAMARGKDINNAHARHLRLELGTQKTVISRAF
jgi:hypothetical protein